MPPLTLIASAFSETVNNWKAMSMWPGIITSWNTSQGPQKSITTAPSETRKATGMLPSAGGLSGFDTAEERAGSADSDSQAATEPGAAARHPKAAEACKSFLRVMCFGIMKSYLQFSLGDTMQSCSGS